MPMYNMMMFVMLGLLLVPLVMVTEAGEVRSEEISGELNEVPMMLMPTDNGSTYVEVFIEKALVEESHFTIDQPQVVNFKIRFLDPRTSEPLEHMNYNLMVTDANGDIVHKIHKGHTHDGMNSYSLLFPDTGSFTLSIELEGTGGPPPFDTTHTGTTTSSIAVTPEFPLGIMAIMATVIGIGVVTTRFKDHLKL